MLRGGKEETELLAVCGFALSSASTWGSQGVGPCLPAVCPNLQLMALPTAGEGACPVLKIGCFETPNSTEPSSLRDGNVEEGRLDSRSLLSPWGKFTTQ